MKVFLDTNVWVAEALLGEMAQQLVESALAAGWRIYCTGHVLDEVGRVMVERLGFSRRLAVLTRGRIARRTTHVAAPASRHRVPQDPQDGPILRAALACGADWLVTNDAHLLSLDPYEGLRIISMARYAELLREHGAMS